MWEDKIKAFLHDSPDKALVLGTSDKHEEVAAQLWEYVGLKDDADKLRKKGLKTYPKIHSADCIASAMQRLNIPSNLRTFGIYYTRDPLKALIKHTLSGSEYNLNEVFKKYEHLRVINKKEVVNFLKRLENVDDWKKKYFILWRFLPDLYSLGYILPADTRIPDHSIWDHLDVTSAIYTCLDEPYMLSVKIPAVQEFIANSRKLADLWASSHIYSTIIFEGIKVLVEELGPDVIIYPQLRGNPMLDLAEFKGEKDKFTLLCEGKKLGILNDEMKKRIYVANLPNTFLALVPGFEVEDLAKKVENAIKRRWIEITDKAKELLKDMGIELDESLWSNQVENAIEVICAWIKFFDYKEFCSVRDEIPQDVRKKQEQWLGFVENYNFGHFYFLTYYILSTMLTQKARLWDDWEEEPKTGKKCLMCGRRNALIENHPNEGYRVWNSNGWVKIDEVNDKHVLKEGERLCAVCLTKRLYGHKEGIFKKLFKIEPPKQESVVYIAAKDFIEKAETDEDVKSVLSVDIELVYKHEWEEKEFAKSLSDVIKEKFKKLWDEIGEPSKYYAILMMDGDRIGKWLMGEGWRENGEEKGLPNFGEFLHPLFKEIIKNNWDKGIELINTRRILSPSHHIAISRILKDFSLYKVPEIVEKYDGLLVYAGGDDILALFPVDKVLDAAYEIQNAFKENFYKFGEKILMSFGERASMSAGIVFAHYKWPLYDVLEKVREAEKKAKNKYGRNAFCITFIRRSGEYITAGAKWDFKSYFDELLKFLSPKSEDKRKVSHRFIYDLIESIREFKKEDERWDEPYVSMLKSDIKRLIKRRDYKRRLTENDKNNLYKLLSSLIDEYLKRNLPLEDIGLLIKILYDAYKE